MTIYGWVLERAIAAALRLSSPCVLLGTKTHLPACRKMVPRLLQAAELSGAIAIASPQSLIAACGQAPVSVTEAIDLHAAQGAYRCFPQP